MIKELLDGCERYCTASAPTGSCTSSDQEASGKTILSVLCVSLERLCSSSVTCFVCSVISMAPLLLMTSPSRLFRVSQCKPPKGAHDASVFLSLVPRRENMLTHSGPGFFPISSIWGSWVMEDKTSDIGEGEDFPKRRAERNGDFVKVTAISRCTL